MIKSLSKMIDTRASYSDANLVKVLFLLDEKPLGRYKLMQELKLNEASTKTLLKNLAKNNLIKSSTKGHILTSKGKSLVRRLRSKIIGPIKIDAKDYTIGEHDSAILIKNAIKRVRLGLEQRDEAIKIGALGATTLIYKNNKLAFPTSSKKITELENILKSHFKLKNGDVVIISTASDCYKAGEGAIAAALSLF